MPRQARIDAPGAVHHIICRGIERKRIFLDDADRDDFVGRLGGLLKKTATSCFAWALIPNHFHLLLRTGIAPIATVMERLLTGYAVYFNHRHNRHGHLFQNRYKSILCQAEPYLLELVRYIHLNPIRAGIVTSMEELYSYGYCGHGSLLGTGNVDWQCTEEVMSRFSIDLKTAQERYLNFIIDGISIGKRADLVGGGLLRSSGGWEKILNARRFGEHLKSDERILGDSDFVEEVLGAAQERMETESLYRERGVTLETTALKVAELFGVDAVEIRRASKKRKIVEARSLLCFWAVRELGLTATAVGKALNFSVSGAARAAERGEKVAIKKGLALSQLS